MEEIRCPGVPPDGHGGDRDLSWLLRTSGPCLQGETKRKPGAEGDNPPNSLYQALAV